MNRWIRPGFLLACLLFSCLLFANRVVVKGTVKFSNGVLVPNFPIVLQTDTVQTNVNCFVTKSVTTGTAGGYDAALECTKTFLKVFIGYKDCNGNYVRVVKEVPASGIIEYNIVLCAPASCHAVFGFSGSTANPGNIQFNSSNSSAAGAYPDEIISRTWKWGDGSPLLDGNIISPNHLFPKDSTYEVCLKITTRNGCSSYSCQNVTVHKNADCIAYFKLEKTNGANEWRLHDSSNTRAGDEIIVRRWTWGDGSAALEGNIKDPAHVFPGPGTYEVCLQIKTRLGCEKRICKNLVIAAEPCKANFGFELLSAANNPANSFRFNSNSSVTGNPAIDIIARRWDFGDGTILEGNIINPVHSYKNGGTYNVCLTIKTAANCDNKICKSITIAANSCKAVFKWEPIPGEITNPPKSYMAFYSGASHGSSATASIVGRRWTFGDGTVLESLDSLVKHGYAQAGTYRVCLYIKTSDGCFDSACNNIIVPDPPNTACVPGFNWKPDGLKFYFNSGITAVATGDKVIKRTWHFGDGTSLDGNMVDPVHVYQRAGNYEVCLAIVTDRGCQQKICKTVSIAATNLPSCKPDFKWDVNGLKAIFNSSTSSIAAGDSIVKRTWLFGDGSKEDGNHINADHVYQRDGQYEVCLLINTKMGCEQKTCKTIMVTSQQSRCFPIFRFENTGIKKVQFNSTGSHSAVASDSIIKRVWNFGDGTSLSGNIVSPVHEFRYTGTYTVCLRVITKSGCETTWCQQVKVEGQQYGDSSHVKLVMTYPNPAKANLYTIVWTKHNNVPAVLSVYDIYGSLKWTKSVLLPQGNSTWPVYIGNLPTGPYILRLSTQYGLQRLQFFRVN